MLLGVSMPITIRCSNCGKVFYHSGRIFSIMSILKGLDRCPNCNKKLNLNMKDVVIQVL